MHTDIKKVLDAKDKLKQSATEAGQVVQDLPEQIQAVEDLIELLEAGQSIFSTNVLAQIKAFYKAGTKIYALFQNGRKLHGAVKMMIEGGLGLRQCDDLKKDIDKWNQ